MELYSSYKKLFARKLFSVLEYLGLYIFAILQRALKMR